MVKLPFLHIYPMESKQVRKLHFFCGRLTYPHPYLYLFFFFSFVLWPAAQGMASVRAGARWWLGIIMGSRVEKRRKIRGMERGSSVYESSTWKCRHQVRWQRQLVGCSKGAHFFFRFFFCCDHSLSLKRNKKREKRKEMEFSYSITLSGCSRI